MKVVNPLFSKPVVRYGAIRVKMRRINRSRGTKTVLDVCTAGKLKMRCAHADISRRRVDLRIRWRDRLIRSSQPLKRLYVLHSITNLTIVLMLSPYQEPEQTGAGADDGACYGASRTFRP